MQRYFINNTKYEINKPSLYLFDKEILHHITNVMRMREGNLIYLCDEKITYLVSLTKIEKEMNELEIKEEIKEDKNLPFEVCLAQGLVRKEKMELVIDGVCEMGATSYLGVDMERSLIHLDKINKDKNERLNKISKEASEQSHRNQIMKVLPFVSFKDFLKFSKEFDLCLFAYEKTKEDLSLKEILRTKQYHKVLILIGPEGGISEKEVQVLKDNNFYPIGLGKRILRTQMACFAAMSYLAYEWGDTDV